MAEQDPFKELPSTRQGLSIYIKYAENEMKKCDRKKSKLEKMIQEAKERLGIKQEDVNASAADETA